MFWIQILIPFNQKITLRLCLVLRCARHVLLYNPVVRRTKRWIDYILAEPLSLVARTVVDAAGAFQLRKEGVRSRVPFSILKIDNHRLVRLAAVDGEAYGDV